VQITEITEQVRTKGRYSVFIDGAFAFGLPMEDVLYFKLKDGNEISQEKRHFIEDNLIYIRAQDTALHFLSYKMRTEKEIFLKLVEKEFSEEMIQRVLAFLEKYKYVDDYKYCCSYIKERDRLQPRAKYALQVELRQKGIKESIIAKALEESDLDEVVGAVRLLEKKAHFQNEFDQKEKQKLVGFLQRKGYSYDIIKEAFSILEQQEN